MESHPEPADNFWLNNSDGRERQGSFGFNQEINERLLP
jgi:hypothetical protein